jgi:hypothetical protein
MKSGKKCGVVAGEFFADLLVFLKGVLGKRVFFAWCLVVSLWWIAWWGVVLRGVFLSAEKCANFCRFIFAYLCLFLTGSFDGGAVGRSVC